MEVKELTLSEIRQTISDMREEAREKRKTADRLRRGGQINRAFVQTGEAICIEHWANRLDNAITNT